MRSYIIVGEAGDRSCHYWISTASFSLHTTQSATNACGKRDGGGGVGREQMRIRAMKAGREEMQRLRWREGDKVKKSEVL